MDERCVAARRLIAQGPMCTVEECRCGVLHVTLGALTIRLQPEVIASIWQTLDEALARLGHHRCDASSASGSGLTMKRNRAERPS
jgi:hypothetical protein